LAGIDGRSSDRGFGAQEARNNDDARPEPTKREALAHIRVEAHNGLKLNIAKWRPFMFCARAFSLELAALPL
jgi:hypothetical protein